MNKTRLLGMLMLLVWIAASGCSHFTSNPQITRLQISNSPNWAKSFRMDSDYPRQKNLEVHFNDRNAIQLDLTWSSETGSTTEFKPKNIVTDSFTYLSPLIVWKYRF